MSFPIFPWKKPFTNFGFNFFNVDNTLFSLCCIHLQSFEELNEPFKQLYAADTVIWLAGVDSGYWIVDSGYLIVDMGKRIEREWTYIYSDTNWIMESK